MGRDTTESTKRLDLTRLKQLGYFPNYGAQISGNIQWSSGGEPTGNIYITVDTENTMSIRMKYRTKSHWQSEDEWRDYDYSFPLEGLPCNFGGFRWVVRCQLRKNGVFCGRRVRILYSVGDYFGCRHCADLTYESCNTNKRFRDGIFGILEKSWKADEYRSTLKRTHYRGRPTRKYRRYLKMLNGFSDAQIHQAELELNRILKR